MDADNPPDNAAGGGASRRAVQETLPALPQDVQERLDQALAAFFFKLATVTELKMGAAAQWLLKRLLWKGGFAVLFGDPGTCKTFLALDIALCIALGLAWAGFRRAQGRVVYILAEGGGGIELPRGRSREASR